MDEADSRIANWRANSDMIYTYIPTRANKSQDYEVFYIQPIPLILSTCNPFLNHRCRMPTRTPPLKTHFPYMQQATVFSKGVYNTMTSTKRKNSNLRTTPHRTRLKSTRPARKSIGTCTHPCMPSIDASPMDSSKHRLCHIHACSTPTHTVTDARERLMGISTHHSTQHHTITTTTTLQFSLPKASHPHSIAARSAQSVLQL